MVSTLSMTASATTLQWRNHVRLHLVEPRSRTEELTGILTTSQYVRLFDVNVIQERFYREQINGVIYFRSKRETAPVMENFNRYEIYLTNLYAKVDSWLLLSIFETIAPVKLFRFMVTYSGECRGFAFLEYYSAEAACFALMNISKLCSYRGIRGIKVLKSIDKRTLEIDRTDLDYSEFVYKMKKIIKVQSDLEQNSIKQVYRKFLVTFQSNRDASIAKRQILLHMHEFSRTKNIKVTWRI
ncbi:hypothetical protein ACFFRR_000291 [Megaselia abdita]